MINSNKLSIPIQIEDTEERSIDTLGLIDSGAGGKFIEYFTLPHAFFEWIRVDSKWNLSGMVGMVGIWLE